MDVTKTTDYVDGKIFENNVLDRIFVDGGYIKGGVYYFYETDHLGDNRTVINQSGTVVERNDYYPYGMQMAHNQLTNSASGSDNKRKFGGKELDVMGGLNLYDSQARMQDPTLGIFTTVDPLAEKYYSWSPYVYCAGNPVNAVDPDGRWVQFLIPLVKGLIGAAVDVGAQMTVSMSNGQGFKEALSNIDYTSVGASFVTSAIAAPGMSTTAKVVTGTAIAADALVDASQAEGVKIAGREKPLPTVAVDAATAVIPGKVVDAATSKFTTAVTTDLTSKSASILTKETKASMKEAVKTVNGNKVQTVANGAVDYVGGVVGGQTNATLTQSNKSYMPPQQTITQPTDAIKTKRPFIPNLPQ